MKRIGDVTTRVSTWNPSRATEPVAFDYIDLGAVDNSRKEVTGAAGVSSAEAPSRARQLVAAGDVLVSTVRPNLNAVAVVPPHLDGATASTGFTVLRPTRDLHGRYLFHWVRSEGFIVDMVRKATGSSYPAVSDRIVKQSELPLPPLAEQRRIATILDHTDSLCLKRSVALAHLDDLKKSCFLEMFGDPRVPGSAGSLPTSPTLLGSLVRIRTGKLDANAAVEDGEFPFFTCASRPSRIDVPAFDCKAILVAGNGDLNVKYYEGQFNAYQRTYVIESADETAALPKFLHAFLDLYVERLRAQSIGGVIKYIKLPYLQEAIVQLPDLQVQHEFVRRAEAVAALSRDQRTQASELDALRVSLVTRMLARPSTDTR
ncbi:restriction endonuclease subunit S [Nocardioides aurantiacus]|uniref:Restriction endonuclease S subunit n=1 Tax=Nocardioides aurantiacus TaxID=86796 RepID=A0A3N2CYP1_9ACTN|nr:restriction endonuclease subunit S [Nocardioides aurantiacus]ROR92596.1 restriction endonuclease S subunit [Nocardioides aurantiacus]